MKKPRNPSLRPVGARALKSAGDTLRPYLDGATVLDLYAGQGRFGVMALEEGAFSAVFVENNHATASSLERSLGSFAGQSMVMEEDVFVYLKSLKEEKFDLVFADPPFDGFSAKLLTTLADAIRPHLQPDSILVVKQPSRMLVSVPPAGYSLWKQSRFGESSFTYFRVAAVGEKE